MTRRRDDFSRDKYADANRIYRKYIFLILGAVTVVWGVISTIFVPDSPGRVSWLSEDEKLIAVACYREQDRNEVSSLC